MKKNCFYCDELVETSGYLMGLSPNNGKDFFCRKCSDYWKSLEPFYNIYDDWCIQELKNIIQTIRRNDELAKEADDFYLNYFSLEFLKKVKRIANNKS